MSEALQLPDLRAIVARLGGQLYAGGKAATVPGPGHSRQDRSLSLRLSEDGERVLWFSHCGDTGDRVWPHLDLPGRAPRPMDRREAERERAKRKEAARIETARKLAFCREVWGQTVPAIGSPVETYLRGRGIAGAIPPTLRFHPAAPLGYPDPSRPLRTHAAMVAIVTGPDGRAAAGLHVTFIKPDGSGKAAMANPRRMFGELIGAAVQLGPIPEGGELGVGEGIETCLSYRDLTGTPTWAALSTAGLSRFPPPAGVTRLVIAADGDPAGLKAARELAERASRRCQCLILPAPEGQDWNNALTGGHP